jgi:hypothetical protein
MTSLKVDDYAVINKCIEHPLYKEGSLVKVTRINSDTAYYTVMAQTVVSKDICAFHSHELTLASKLGSPEYFI